MEKTICPRCFREMDAEVPLCRQCGQPRETLATHVLAEVEIVPEPTPTSEDPRLILILLFFGVGPLALPMLWRCPAFSRAKKWFVTLVIIPYSALVCWLLWVITRAMVVTPLQQLQQLILEFSA